MPPTRPIMTAKGQSPNLPLTNEPRGLTFRVAETFTSRQGEGMLTGTMSHFIRLSGCNLRCWFCDTPYASWEPEGDWRAVNELIDGAIESGTNYVVLTGGEPLLPAASTELVESLQQAGMHVTIETAGTVYRPVAADLMSISPKLSGSGPATGTWSARHESQRWRPQVIQQLIDSSKQHQVKFVVDSPQEFAEAKAAVAELGLSAANVWIMPQGISVDDLEEKRNWLEPLVTDAGYQYCQRMQILWYGNRRGT